MKDQILDQADVWVDGERARRPHQGHAVTKVEQHIPEGFPVDMLVLPKAASELVAAIEQARWLGVIQFVDEESAGGPFFTVTAAHPRTGQGYRVTWHSRDTQGKSYRLFGKIQRKAVGAPWKYAPSATVIRQFISNNPAEEVVSP